MKNKLSQKRTLKITKLKQNKYVLTFNPDKTSIKEFNQQLNKHQQDKLLQEVRNLNFI